MRKVAVVTTASASGGTTLGRELARRLGVPFHELDALFWKPGWVESTADELRARVEPIVATDGWVIDGSYQSKIGQLVLGAADIVVWLDLPLRTWLPRLVVRSYRRWRTWEELWGANTYSFRRAFLSGDSLIVFTLRHFRRTRRRNAERFAAYEHVRLRSQADVDRYLRSVARAT